MFIGVLGYIATNDLLSASEREQLGTYPPGRAGAPLISNLIKEYIARGHRVVAITHDPTLNSDEPPFVYEKGLLTYVVVPCRKHTFRPNGRRPGRTFDFYTFERNQMLAVLQHYKPEFVHAHWTYEFALAALAYTPDALITVHDNARVIFKYVRTLERFFLTLMAWYVYKKGRRFTAVSPYMAKSISDWVGKVPVVVANPVTIPQRNKLVSKPDHPILTTVVNGWDDRKNCKKALLAFKEIHRLHPNAVLWAFGTAFEPNKEAVAFCNEHQIENVVFYGSTPHTEVLKKVSECTVLLHTSLEESFGMVLAEAMSYGIPVVAGKDSGAVPWVVQDGGILVDVTNVNEIVNAVHQLISDQTLYARLANKAIQIIEKRFPIQVIASQYLGLYQEQTESIHVSNKLHYDLLDTTKAQTVLPGNLN
jgi:glycosyltransferase involved in cell wall biosynthesis